jgi:two-component system, chemotaxis family, protein-glutamate methylesterase/glutaminase
MAKRDVVVIGASAGGFEALRSIAHMLPPGFPAAIVVVLHLAPTKPSNLAYFLTIEGGMPAVTIEDGQALTPGVIYVAPPNLHAVIEGDILRLDPGPHENGFRPAIDRLFRSAAVSCGSRTIGVVLSGMRDDGAEGLALIKRCGGIAIVQDPKEALYPSMPEAALDNLTVDRVVTIAALPSVLQSYVAAEASAHPQHVTPSESETDVDQVFVCPECGGVAREVQEANMVRYRCRVGHVYNSESFVEEHSRGVEDALWYAVNALSERKSLTRRMARRAREAGRARVAERYEQLAQEAEQRAESIRRLLLPAIMETAAAANNDSE